MIVNRKTEYKTWFFLFIIISSCFINISCNTNNEGEQLNVVSHNYTFETPQFNEDSALFFINKQLKIGTGTSQTKTNSSNDEWICEKLKSYGFSVTHQQARILTDEKKVLTFKNIIGAIKPKEFSRILLCTHWNYQLQGFQKNTGCNLLEQRQWNGIIGVGILLEIARNLMIKNPSIGVDIVLLGADEDINSHDSSEGYFGLSARYWAKNPHKEGYQARIGVLLDFAGYPEARFRHEGFSKQYAPNALAEIWWRAFCCGYGSFFINEDGGRFFNDHVYINESLGIPTIVISEKESEVSLEHEGVKEISNEETKHIDKKTLRAVGQTLLTVIFENQ